MTLIVRTIYADFGGVVKLIIAWSFAAIKNKQQKQSVLATKSEIGTSLKVIKKRRQSTDCNY